jgi:hypothetical protein
MSKRRLLAVAVCAAAIPGLSAGSAFAGEVTGNGKDTPIRDGVAKSECAFSGLDEAFSGPDDPDPFTHAQSWGQLVKQFGPMGGVPGVACNGHLSPQK